MRHKYGVLALTIIASILFFSCKGNKEADMSSVINLQPPQVFKLESTKGRSFLIRGMGHPKANVGIYLNGELMYGTQVNDDGQFSQLIEPKEEGIHQLTLNQTYRNGRSELTAPQEIEVDLTPPHTLEFISKIPEQTKETTLEIRGKMEPKAKIVGTDVVADENGQFKMTVDLKEGLNSIPIKVADEYGNVSDILKTMEIFSDSTPPMFEYEFFQPSRETCSSKATRTKEYVCLNYGKFWGTSPYRVPFIGYVVGDVKSVTIKGRTLKWNEDGLINQILPLPMIFGTNNLEVIITDGAGNKTKAVLSVDVISAEERRIEAIEEHAEGKE